GDVLVVNAIPLLFEVLDPASFDAVVLVAAPVALRRTRLRAMRGLSNEEADRMIAAQMPAERKRSRSHHVIDNDGTVAELEANARAVFDEPRRRAAAAALGRPARSLLLAGAVRTAARERAGPAAIGARGPTASPVRWLPRPARGRRGSARGAPECSRCSATIPIPSRSGSISVPGATSRSSSPSPTPPA